MRIQVISDVHLEMRDNRFRLKIIPIKRDNYINVLVLAGDIGNPFQTNYSNFLEDCSESFDHVIVIAGNHEYYSFNKTHTMTEIENQLMTVTGKFENVYYLNQSSVIIQHNEKQVKFVGCTLWTLSDIIAQNNMNDYNQIYVKDELFYGSESYKRSINFNDINSLHLNMKSYLENEILPVNKQKDNLPVVVVTHHAPSKLMLQNINKDDILQKYYANDLEDLIKSPVRLWCSGHTHHSKTMIINGIPCMSNCYGYPNQTSRLTKYDANNFVDIE